ncbi:MAG: putative baseplate assembly protein, partial [Rhodothermales bacterium]|nr:putative baseplate assembly protein [Rhodothermales bacterium]
AAARVQDPRAALPAIELRDADGETWRPERDLLASDRFDPDFVAEVETDGRTRLRFGDDIYARRPEEGVAIEATYRVGSGPVGNVGAGALFHLLATPGLGIDVSDPDRPGIRNPLPAVGAVAPESLDEVRLYAPQAFRRQERAVTEADYAEVAARHPEVSKAVARRLWTGSWHTMFITVDRVGGRPVDAPFEAVLRAWIDRFKLAGHDVEIEPPRFVSLDVALTVCVEKGYLRSNVKRALLDVFSSVDLPDGRRGYFHPDRFTFGQRVYLSDLIATAMDVPGVRWVEVDPAADPPGRFQRWGEAERGEITDGFIDIGRLEIARLDNDPNAPEHGKIEFHMEGGL